MLIKKVGPGLEVAPFKDVENLPGFNHPVNIRDKKAKKKRSRVTPLHIYFTSLRLGLCLSYL